MARANFGGQADSSQTLAFLYDAYARRQQEAADRAIRDAAEEQAAADQDAMNRWENGEMSDSEWIAYLKGRIKETTDAEEKTQLREALRNAQETIAVRRVEEGTMDLMNRIEDGTASWNDLRRFLVRERAKANQGSDLYRELSGRIDQVGDRIRDNATNAAIGEAQYLFQTGQISGAEAARRIKAAASRYKTSDPGKYYSLLSSAYDLQTHGMNSGGGGGGRSGGGGGGRRRSGGGRGGGGGGATGDVIDSLKWQEDAIELLNEQFDNGKRVGTLPDGTQVVIADENGNPTSIWRQIDQMMVDGLDAQYEARLENGERGAVEVLIRKENYIANRVQPRNTIPKEQQFAAFTRDLQRGVEIGAVDPEQGRRTTSGILARMESWANKLNTISNVAGHGQHEVDDDTARKLRDVAGVQIESSAAGELRQVTPTFEQGVHSFVQAARQAFNNPNMTPEQAQQVLAQVEGFMTQEQAAPLLGGVQQVATVAQGLEDGDWVRVMQPDGTMAVVPLSVRNVPGPDGQMVRDIAPDIELDPDAQAAVQVLREVDGRPQLVWAVGDYRDVQGQRMLAIADERGRTFAQTEQGAWLNSAGEQVPMPSFVQSNSQAQRWVNANPDAAAKMLQTNGVDPATVDMSNLFFPTKGIPTESMSETRRDYRAMQSASDGARSWRPSQQMTGVRQPDDLLNPPSLQSILQGTSGSSPMVMAAKVGASLGINFGVQARGASGIGNVDVRRPNIAPVNIKPVSVARPKLRFNLDLPRLATRTTISPEDNADLIRVRQREGQGGFI